MQKATRRRTLRLWIVALSVRSAAPSGSSTSIVSTSPTYPSVGGVVAHSCDSPEEPSVGLRGANPNPNLLRTSKTTPTALEAVGLRE
jgi:hypothetical protein